MIAASRFHPRSGTRVDVAALPRKRVVPSRTPYTVAALAGLGLHLWLALPIYSWSDRLGGWLLLAVLLEALLDFRRRGEHHLPVVVLVAAQVYLFYGVPQFSQEKIALLGRDYYPPADTLSSAVWLVVLGELAFLAAYGVALRWMKGTNPLDRILPQPHMSWRTAVLVYSAPAFTLHMLNSLRPDYIPVAIRMAALQFFNVYLALGLLLYFGYKLRDGHSLLIAWALIAIMGFVGLIQGVMGNIVFPVILAILAAWIWTHSVRTWLVVLVVFATLVVNPAKNEFRRLAWGDKDVSSTEKVIGRIGDWNVSFSRAWGGSSTDQREQNVSETASRSSDLLSFAQAIEYVPARIPYNHAEGLGTSLIYWVPRIFWPSKPISTDLLFNRYAIEFGYATEEGTRTSTTGASVFTEGYWNFGVTGVVTFLAVSGFLVAVLLGHNGRRGDASTLVAIAYLGATMLLLQPVALIAPGAITFAAGMVVAMWSISWIANPTNPISVLRVR